MRAEDQRNGYRAGVSGVSRVEQRPGHPADPEQDGALYGLPFRVVHPWTAPSLPPSPPPSSPYTILASTHSPQHPPATCPTSTTPMSKSTSTRSRAGQSTPQPHRLSPNSPSHSLVTEPHAHVDLEYPSSVPTFTVNPTQLSSSSQSPLPWFSAFGRKDANAPLPSEVDPKYSDPAYYSSASTYGKNGRNSSHTAKKPEGHIKRPPNCFLLFRYVSARPSLPYLF